MTTAKKGNKQFICEEVFSDESTERKRQGKFQPFKKLFGRRKQTDSEAALIVAQLRSSQSTSEFDNAELSEDEETNQYLSSLNGMGSRAFSHDSIFISEVSEEDGSSVRVMSEESTSGKVKSIQRQIAHNIKFGHKPVSAAVRKVEEFGDSSEDEEHPRCVIQVVADVEVNPSDTLTKSTDYLKASSSNEENNWNNGDKKDLQDLTHSEEHQDKDSFRKNIGIKSKEEGDVLSASIEQNKIPNEQMFKEFQNERKRIEVHDKLQEHLHYNKSKGDQEQMQKDKLLHENVMQKDYETAIQTSKISEERKEAVAENVLYEGKHTDEKENEDQRQLEWEKPKKQMTEEQRPQNFEEQRCVVTEQRRRQNEQSQHVLEKTKKLETKEWKQMEDQGLYDTELKKMETKERQHNHLQEQKQHLLIEHKEKKAEGYNENAQMLKDAEQQQKWEQRKQMLDVQRHQEMEEDQLRKADQQMKQEFEKQRRQEAEEETQQDLAKEIQDVENQRKLKVEEQRQQEIKEQKKKEQKMQEVEEHKKKEIKEQRRKEAELQIKRELENQRQQDFEEKKKKEAEEKNKKELEEQRQQELEEKRKREAEEQKKRELEHQRQRDLEEQKKREDEEKKKELEEHRKLDLEAKRKWEAEEKRQRELEDKRMQEAEKLKQRELEEQRQRELKEQRKQEAEKLKKMELEEQRRQDKEVLKIQEVEKQTQIENEKQRRQDLQEQLIDEHQLKILDERKRREAEAQKQWNVRSKCPLVAKEQMNLKAEKGQSDEAEEIMQEWEKEQKLHKDKERTENISEINANQTELEIEDNQRFDPQEQERRREELRWQDMEERHAAPRPFTFKVSSGEKQIIFQKVNLTPVTPVNHHSNPSDQKESKSLSGAKGAHSLPSSLYIPHTAILVTGAQLCGTAVNMDQIKDTACKSLLGLSEDKKTLDLPPVNSRSEMSPEGKPSTIKSRSLHEGNQSSAAILAEWAMIRSRILKSADNGKLHERDSRHQVRHATEDCSQKGITSPHTSLRKTMSASAKFSITPAWQKFPDSPKTISNEPSKPRFQNERDATKTRTLSLDLDSADSSPCKAKERSIQAPKSTKTPDSTEGYVFAKDLPSFLVPSPPHGSQKGRSLSETQTPQENQESAEKRVSSSEEKVSPFGIKLRRTNYSLRYHSEQQAEQKRKKRYSAGDNFEGIPAPLLPIGHEKSTLSTKGTAVGSLKNTTDNNATGPEARLTLSKINIPAIHGESERHLLKPTAYQKPCLAPKPSCATPPSSPLDKSEKSKIVESQRTVKEGLAPLKKKDDVKEDTLPVSSQRSQNEEEECKEKKSFFPSINIPWRERIDRKTELIKREKPTLQSRHSLDSSRLPEKGESSQPLWITLALQKQRGFREQQSTREERRQAREAKLAEKQAKENNGNGSLAEKKASSDQAPQKPTTQTEEKKPESLLSRFERREQLRKSNTLPNSVTVEIADSSSPSPKDVPKRFPPSESAQVTTEPAWLALAKRKAKAWSDCPQIIK